MSDIVRDLEECLIVEDLEKCLTLMIAKTDGITPQEVTSDYIEAQRKYRDEVLGLPIIGIKETSYGLMYLTGKQRIEFEKSVDMNYRT